MISDWLHAVETWLVLALLSLFGLVYWKGREAIAAGLKTRINTITQEIAQAEQVLAEAEAALAKAQQASAEKKKQVELLFTQSQGRRLAITSRSSEELELALRALQKRNDQQMALAKRKAKMQLREALVERVFEKIQHQTLPHMMSSTVQSHLLARQMQQLHPEELIGG